jgi:hypothetical protein
VALFDGISDIGSGIGGLFQSSSLKAAAGDLNAAGASEDQNAKIAASSTEIQTAAIHRDILKTIGGQQSDIATAGFQMSGTALDLAQDTARQGALAEALTTNQGAIEVSAHKAQAQSYYAQARDAQRQSKSAGFGGILQIGLGILGMFSDKRLKTNIVRVGTNKAGLPIVKYNYLNDPTEWIGYLAQDVEKLDPSAVRDLGMKMVDSEYRPQRV